VSGPVDYPVDGARPFSGLEDPPDDSRTTRYLALYNVSQGWEHIMDELEQPAAAQSTIEAAPSADQHTPATQRPALSRRRPVQLGAAVVVVAAGVGIYFAASSGPAQVHVRGTLSLGALAATPTGGTATNGGPCQANQGYDDITAGATVAVGGSNGQTLAVGALSSGVEANVDTSLGFAAGNCVFSFDVAVPGGQSAYTVTISHRGTQTFTPAQVAAGIQLTLGQ